ncbi:carboxypeptidase-like regulatory domain-containing protein [Blastopirellula sp. JC732]|uniref:Carboxypeptidase-like regulatory domain-containing protein n=1 Tax=Blastopirellula sediminis TaxID=2894196 RepID=A0A9X1MTX8_9BACT|nr:carboxypeptidase-like regulatory domain-containing protein [Blastopirellula sediminis]MCC9604684.1 carboxypeptidase-like regulatory domain-containing protein [Blastopirellula sediminis]MCC9632017.1 carboxypeptidase-like regulatory domain-containing protein [Blastopirellula sediminis]
MYRMISNSPWLALAIMTAAFVGCGNDLPPVGEVYGTVKLNGEPVEGCQVMFEPIAGGRSSSAMTDADGRYTLRYNGDADGALLGKHKVRLITARGTRRDDNGRIVDPGVKEKLPKEYNSETTQVVEVTSGDNPIDFEVAVSK